MGDGPVPLFRERAGEALRRRRQALGLRLVDAARRAGVSPQYLSEVERGRKDPSSEVLEAAAGALGLDLDDLLVDVVRHGPDAVALPDALPVPPTPPSDDPAPEVPQTADGAGADDGGALDEPVATPAPATARAALAEVVALPTRRWEPLDRGADEHADRDGRHLVPRLAA